MAVSLPVVGGSTGTWGSELNTALTALDTAISNMLSALNSKANTSHTHAAGDVTSGVFAIGRIPVSVMLSVKKSGSTWPNRPTSDPAVVVQWIGADPSPSIVTTGTAGMYEGDLRQIPQ